MKEFGERNVEPKRKDSFGPSMKLGNHESIKSMTGFQDGSISVSKMKMKREAENRRKIRLWWMKMKMKMKKKMKMKRKLKDKISEDIIVPGNTEFVLALDLGKETQLDPPPCSEETQLDPPPCSEETQLVRSLSPPRDLVVPPLIPPPDHLFDHNYCKEDLVREGDTYTDAYYFSEAEEAETTELFDAKLWGKHPVTHLNICDCPILVKLYAEMGLHRYNLLENTSYQFDRVQGYFMDGFPSCATYLINLFAREPPSTSLVPFQTCVNERSHKAFDVTCHFATPDIKCVNGFDDTTWPSSWPPLPAWPSETHIKDKLYQLQKSEWEANDYCILLYLKLAFFATSRIRDKPQLTSLAHSDPSALKIVNVVVETTEQPEQSNEPLLKSAVFYITYDHDLGDDGVFDHQRAIVRRTVHPITKHFWLKGKILYGSTKYKALVDRFKIIA